VIRRGLLGVLAAVALASCSGGSESGDEPERASSPAAAAELTDVAGVLDLRAAFNADSGRPRLLLLLSPT
jgi:hypothetical protein